MEHQPAAPPQSADPAPPHWRSQIYHAGDSVPLEDMESGMLLEGVTSAAWRELARGRHLDGDPLDPSDRTARVLQKDADRLRLGLLCKDGRLLTGAVVNLPLTHRFLPAPRLRGTWPPEAPDEAGEAS